MGARPTEGAEGESEGGRESTGRVAEGVLKEAGRRLAVGGLAGTMLTT